MSAADLVPSRRTLVQLIWVLLPGFCFANVEIQIEGRRGLGGQFIDLAYSEKLVAGYFLGQPGNDGLPCLGTYQRGPIFSLACIVQWPLVVAD